MTQLAGVTLPDNLHWSDEFGWSPVDQATERTLSGALVVEETERQSGRPITLVGLWVPRSTVEALRALEAQVATAMTLILPGGGQHTVFWRREGDRPAVAVTPLWEDAPDVYTSDSTYRLELRLMEI